MKTAKEAVEALTYPVRVAVRITGLKPEVLRAWEARYQAISPLRTKGGSRRYSVADLDRLKLLRDVVDSGHRIGRVANLSLADLRTLLSVVSASDEDAISGIVAAAGRLDGIETHRLLADQVSRLEPVAFVKTVALPLLREVGTRWERGELSVSAEHLATRVLRRILASILDEDEDRPSAPRILFATPSDEPHDLGTLVAAVLATRGEAVPVFIGANVPTDDLIESTIQARAAALALGIVTLAPEDSERTLLELRRGLPESIPIWIGGAGIEGLAPRKGVQRIENLEQLEAQVAHLRLGGAAT